MAHLLLRETMLWPDSQEVRASIFYTMHLLDGTIQDYHSKGKEHTGSMERTDTFGRSTEKSSG